MEYQATAKYIHASTRKVRLLADSVRTLSLEAAVVQLTHIPKAAAQPLLKVMKSAIANAKQKNVTVDTLKIKTIEVMGAGAMKRWHAVSRGQAHPYKKRMTHIRVVLTDENGKEVKKA